MKRIMTHIEEREAEFGCHPFFKRLEGPGTQREVAVLARGMTFFIMAFQDMLRLNAERVDDPQLRAIADQQRRDDTGHERWFMHDLRALQGDPAIDWLFGDEHQVTRDISYELMSKVYAVRNDHLRIAIPLVLEATGAEFFSRVYGFAERAELPRLRFFSRKHWDVEQSHEMFEPEETAILSSHELSPEEAEEGLRIVDDMFASITKMVSAIETELVAAGASAPIDRAHRAP